MTTISQEQKCTRMHIFPIYMGILETELSHSWKSVDNLWRFNGWKWLVLVLPISLNFFLYKMKNHLWPGLENIIHILGWFARPDHIWQIPLLSFDIMNIPNLINGCKSFGKYHIANRLSWGANFHEWVRITSKFVKGF